MNSLRGPKTMDFQKLISRNRRDLDNWLYIEKEETKGCKVVKARRYVL